MPHPSIRKNPRRRSGGERVFSDDAGRLWSASHTRGTSTAIVFACISDSRQSVRAIAVDTQFGLADSADDELRAFLRDAPRIGRLT